MSEAPKFNLSASNIGITQDKLEEELNKQGGKFFDPGNYDLEIDDADFHKNRGTQSIYCANDGTWLNVVITFRGLDDRQIKTWLQVPTSKITFGAKNTYAVYRKFAAFMAAIGQAITTDNLSSVVPKYFSDPKKLKGLKLNADIGYAGAYIDRVSETEYRIVKGDKPLEDGDGIITFPDRKAAAAYAQGERIDVRFPEVTKYTPAKVSQTAKVEDDGW